MEIINTDKAPKAIGPYSQAVQANNFIFVSGQIPFVPETMEIISDDVQQQTRQSIENLKAILDSKNIDLSSVVKCTVFIKDMNDFGKINEIYEEYFGKIKPARACIEVARLPRDVKVEIEAIAISDY